MRPDDWGGIVDGLIAQICVATGWTWDYCEDALTMPRLKALAEEYGRALGLGARSPDAIPRSGKARGAFPPKPSSASAVAAATPRAQGDLEELAALFKGGVLR